MGMYDTIIIKDFLCPICQKVNEEIDVQTKELHNALDTYSFPDVVKNFVGPYFDRSYHELEEKLTTPIAEISLAGSCIHCKKFLIGTGYIQDEILFKYHFQLKNSNIQSSREIPLFPGLKEILIKNEELKEDKKHLRSLVEALIFAMYNGDKLDEEVALRVDTLIKSEVFRRYKDHLGKKEHTGWIGPLHDLYNKIMNKGSK
jgi:hypothetical protein